MITDQSEASIILTDQSQGAVIGAKKTTTVNIANDENFAQLLNNMMELTNSQLDGLSLYRSSWTDQLKVLKHKCIIFIFIYKAVCVCLSVATSPKCRSQNYDMDTNFQALMCD